MGYNVQGDVMFKLAFTVDFPFIYVDSMPYNILYDKVQSSHCSREELHCHMRPYGGDPRPKFDMLTAHSRDFRAATCQ
jgi:hypothetical protein